MHMHVQRSILMDDASIRFQIYNSQMNFEESFTCPVCLQLAKQAVQTQCCAKIYCEKCIQDIQKKFGECPCCRSKQLTWHQSRIARKVISEIKVPCTHCEAKVESGAMEAHLTKCPKVSIQCRICKEVMFQQIIPKHTATVHQKEAKDYLIAYALGLKDRPESKLKQPPPPSAIKVDPANLFKPMMNKFNLKATLGTIAKYYCGGKLLGKCGCCDGGCGPDNGENCDGCMELDVKRWRLDKGYLINTAGFVCQVLQVQGLARASCFRLFQMKSGSLFTTIKNVECKPGQPCDSCAQMDNSLKLGRYTGLY